MTLGERSRQSGRELRTVIVDDSALARLLLRDALSRIPGVRVVGNASEGRAAIDVVAAVSPDLVTLDVEMPGISGLEVLKILKTRHPNLSVLMCSRLTESGTATATEALTLGAFDVITKPSGRNRDENVQELSDSIAERIRPLLGESSVPASSSSTFSTSNPASVLEALAATATKTPARGMQPVTPRTPSTSQVPIDVVLIGSSTGGPAALRQLLMGLRKDLRVPVCIVQHIPPGFSKPLAGRLDQSCPLKVVEAEDGQVLEAGHVYLAPGGRHLLLEGTLQQPTLRLNDGEIEHGCRPAVDATLRSVQALFGPRALVVILTGMGRDGAAGAAAIRRLGGRVFVQAPDTCTVSSMPRHTIDLGGADAVGSLEELSQWINESVH